jgi:polyvinyl alcohol dehydrogenase (cytochrome)
MLAVRLALLPVVATLALPLFAVANGEEVYKRICQNCHEAGDARAPGRQELQTMSAARIVRTLDFGIMMSVTSMLTREERHAVAGYLGAPEDNKQIPATAYCADRAVKVPAKPNVVWNGWSPEPTNTRYQAAPGLTLDQVKGLKLKWAFGFEGDVNSFGPPAILDDQMFVGSAGGAVHALDSKTGCIRWVYQADGPVRTAMLVAPRGNGRHAVLFADQTGWFYSVDAATGKLLWRRKPEVHEATKLTGTAAVVNGVVYVPTASWEENRALNANYHCCSFRGAVVAYRIATGERLWKSFMVQPAPKLIGKTANGTPVWGPSGAGIWSAPTVDRKRRLLYVTTGNNYSSYAVRAKAGEACVGDDDDAPVKGPAGSACGKGTPNSDAVVALRMDTGRIAWSKQVTPHDVFNGQCSGRGDCVGPDFDFGSSVILETGADGKDVLLAGQKSGVVWALDPDKRGEILWQQKVGRGGTNGGVQWGMASDGQRVYAAVSDLGRIRRAADPLEFRPAAADPKVGGGLTAIRISDGEKVWFAAPTPCPPAQAICSMAQPAAVTAIPGAVLSGSVDGHIRAFAAEDGKIVWDFDTAREFPTVNGVHARGGSLDGPGAVVAGGMVYVVSGYARNGGMAGNVLLAFGAE